MVPDARKSDFLDYFAVQLRIFSSYFQKLIRILSSYDRDLTRIVAGSKRGNLKGVDT